MQWPGRRSTPQAVSRRLSHLHFFMLGWLFYLGLPLTLGFAGWLDGIGGAAPFANYFSFESRWWAALLWYVALVPVFFAVGSKAGTVLRLPRVGDIPVGAISKALLVLYVPLLGAYAFQAREFLFEGYLAGVDSSVVGPLATMEILLLFQCLVCSAAGFRGSRNAYGALLAVCSLLLLGMGGRLYVLTALVALYFMWWKWGEASSRARWASLFGALLLVAGLVALGMLRVGDVDLDQVAFYLLVEPVYAGISALSLVLNGSWSLLDTPRDFFSGFINLVPAALWPGKSDYVVSLLDTTLDLESPFGGLSIVASTIGNFGYVGGLAFIAFVGAVVGWSSKNQGSALGRALYCVLVAMLPFMFFRDPFPVQVKVVLTAFALVTFQLLIAPRRRRLSWKVTRSS